jgi:hypothetical protein
VLLTRCEQGVQGSLNLSTRQWLKATGLCFSPLAPLKLLQAPFLFNNLYPIRKQHLIGLLKLHPVMLTGCSTFSRIEWHDPPWKGKTQEWCETQGPILIHSAPLVMVFCSVTVIILSVRQDAFSLFLILAKAKSENITVLGCLFMSTLWICSRVKTSGQVQCAHYLEGWGGGPLSQHLGGQPGHHPKTLLKEISE